MGLVEDILKKVKESPPLIQRTGPMVPVDESPYAFDPNRESDYSDLGPKAVAIGQSLAEGVVGLPNFVSSEVGGLVEKIRNPETKWRENVSNVSERLSRSGAAYRTVPELIQLPEEKTKEFEAWREAGAPEWKENADIAQMAVGIPLGAAQVAKAGYKAATNPKLWRKLLQEGASDPVPIADKYSGESVAKTILDDLGFSEESVNAIPKKEPYVPKRREGLEDWMPGWWEANKTDISEVRPSILDEGPPGWNARNTPTRVDYNQELPVSLLRDRSRVDIVRGADNITSSPEDFQKLVDDVRKRGIITPITIAVERDGKITIVDGTHRLAAAESAGMKTIPVSKIEYRGNIQRNPEFVVSKFIEEQRNETPQYRSQLVDTYHPPTTEDLQSVFGSYEGTRQGLANDILPPPFTPERTAVVYDNLSDIQGLPPVTKRTPEQRLIEIQEQGKQKQYETLAKKAMDEGRDISHLDPVFEELDKTYAVLNQRPDLVDYNSESRYVTANSFEQSDAVPVVEVGKTPLPVINEPKKKAPKIWSGEASQQCPNRIAWDAEKNLIEKEVGHVLTPEESLALTSMKHARGEKAPCPMCFVEEHRDNIGVAFENFRQPDPNLLPKKSTLKDPQSYPARWAAINAGQEIPADLIVTPEKYADNPLLMGVLNEFNTKYKTAATMAKPFDQGIAKYEGDFASLLTEEKMAAYPERGVRLNPNSDLTPANAPEEASALIDLDFKGMKAYEYAKEPAKVDIFGDTGLKINLGILLDQDASGAVIDYGLPGVPWEVAKAKRLQSRDTGVIAVALNDAQVEWAGKQPWIDMIIPAHHNKVPRKILLDRGWFDYGPGGKKALRDKWGDRDWYWKIENDCRNPKTQKPIDSTKINWEKMREYIQTAPPGDISPNMDVVEDMVKLIKSKKEIPAGRMSVSDWKQLLIGEEQ